MAETTTPIQATALRALMAEAAEEGARRALREIGLHDDAAARDVRELRGLLEAWRDARRTAWRAVVKALTTAVLIALAIGVASQIRGR
ncbi:hypothetical protein GCM10010964_43700 [Caldovatus sediminis]|uniref:Transmembrane protein n=1 Tax=Caldovatus sediminis TaxID=2041189 RepID=A0A8J3EED0_9PROT|nr:DUF6127 family protein [Caldovatus sediminis]GGG51776.1 hypothetical protein GCM10010964_43700 [Caldovatus sediminis]